MSYVLEYAKSVHDALLAPRQFTKDLQQVISNAIHVLSFQYPQQVRRYQQIHNALQRIQNTSKLFCVDAGCADATSPQSCPSAPANGSGGASQVGQTSKKLTTEHSQGSHDHLQSSSSGNHAASLPFEAAAKRYLAGIATAAQLQDLQSVDAMSGELPRLALAIKDAVTVVEKYQRSNQTGKMEAAAAHHSTLVEERSAILQVINTKLDACFPTLYRKMLHEYIHLCRYDCRFANCGLSDNHSGANSAFWQPSL